MKTFRIVLGTLAIFPVAIIIASIMDAKLLMRHPEVEWAYLLVGIPILVLNLWAWDAPEIIKKVFGVKD